MGCGKSNGLNSKIPIRSDFLEVGLDCGKSEAGLDFGKSEADDEASEI